MMRRDAKARRRGDLRPLITSLNPLLLQQARPEEIGALSTKDRRGLQTPTFFSAAAPPAAPSALTGAEDEEGLLGGGSTSPSMNLR